MYVRDKFPNKIMGIGIYKKIDRTASNLEKMLEQLKSFNGDESKLNDEEKVCYDAYNIEAIKIELLQAHQYEWPQIIKNHLLMGDASKFSDSCLDMYLVAYVSKNVGKGKAVFTHFTLENKLVEKEKLSSTAWSVAKDDGKYLGILNEDGSVSDDQFFDLWIKDHFR